MIFIILHNSTTDGDYDFTVLCVKFILSLKLNLNTFFATYIYTKVTSVNFWSKNVALRKFDLSYSVFV